MVENTNLEGPCEIKPLELEKTCKISNPTFNDTSREKPEPWGHQESSPKGTVTGWEDTPRAEPGEAQLRCWGNSSMERAGAAGIPIPGGVQTHPGDMGGPGSAGLSPRGVLQPRGSWTHRVLFAGALLLHLPSGRADADPVLPSQVPPAVGGATETFLGLFAVGGHKGSFNNSSTPPTATPAPSAAGNGNGSVWKSQINLYSQHSSRDPELWQLESQACLNPRLSTGQEPGITEEKVELVGLTTSYPTLPSISSFS